ncbi:zinc finger MYM-type protein 1-like [Pomacea canaliculata]|uniref:zinc finger MYM-type protein 1-like n=1 Tax=Pomacea canaliculata TaxID=400727 RepID=UPI000D734DAF|nr:zinc finger MYM-type protein 1-like [Pomacea canaliculata]
MCCKDALSPFQPVSDIILSKTERSFSTSSARRLKASWFELYPWLHLCTTNYKAYCFICMQAAHHHASSKADQAFISIGFNNWKKAIEKFNCHQMSSAHRAVVGNKMARESGISVYGQISTQYESQQKQNLASFMNELKSLVFLLRQALPIRGHDDDEGNLHQCLKICFSEHKWTEDGRYLSPEIVNELIQIMAHSILRSVLADIRQANWFAILADETRDISNREQLVICIRWVTEQYEVVEEPVGLLQLDNSSAVTIFSALKDCLIRLNLPVEKCRGQAYDGASTFQGHISGGCKAIQR